MIAGGVAFCAGYAVALLGLLDREGVDANIVQMTATDHPRGSGAEHADTHVVVQARLDGNLAILDAMAGTIIPHAHRRDTDASRTGDRATGSRRALCAARLRALRHGVLVQPRQPLPGVSIACEPLAPEPSPSTRGLMLRRVSLTVTSRLALTVFGLLASIISARALGEAGRGDYFFMVTLSATIVQFTNFGLPIAATYYVAQDRRLAASVVANAGWVSVIAAMGTGICVALVAHAVGMLQDTPVRFLLLAAFLARPDAVLHDRRERPDGPGAVRQFNVLEAVSRAVALVAVVVAAVVGAGAGGYVGATIAAWIVAACRDRLGGAARHRMRVRFDIELFGAASATRPRRT